MSGRTIGTIAGAAIGFFIPVVGVALGATIGGIIGGALKPDKLQGVQLDDVPLQTSTSGNPRAIVLGTSPVKGTRIICQSEIRIETETERQGKGGPEIENDVAYQDFTIEVCESSELRGTLVEGIVAVWEDGLLVYDVRTSPLISGADSAKWKQGVTFYYGEETQGADPTEESIYGIGNVPAYRGTCRMVFNNRKISPRNSISNYEVLVSRCAVAGEGGGGSLTSPRFLGTGNLAAGLRAACRPLSFGGVWLGPSDIEVDPTSTSSIKGMHRFGSDIVAAIYSPSLTLPIRVANISNVNAWTDGTTLPSSSSRLQSNVSGGRLFTFGYGSTVHYITSVADVTFTAGGSFSGGNISNNVIGLAGNGTNVVAVNDYGQLWGSSNNGTSFTVGIDLFNLTSPNRFYTSKGSIDVNGSRFIVAGGETSLLAYFTDDFGVTATACSFPSGARGDAIAVQVKHCGGGKWLIAVGDSATPHDDGLYLSVNNGATFLPVNLPVPMYFGKQFNQNIAVDEASGRVVIAGQVHGTGEVKYYFTDDFSTWTEISRAGTGVDGIVGSLGFLPTAGSAPIPDAPDFYIDTTTGETSGPSMGVGESCGTTLDQVVSLVTRLCDIPDSQVDVTELEDTVVRGITIQSLDPGRTILEPVQQTWFFDLPEFDSKLRAHVRGQVLADVVIDAADLLDTGDEEEDWRRGQMVSYPRKHHLGYMSLDLDYVVTDIPAERQSPDVRVVGESRIASIGVHSDEEAAQIADRQLKVMWTEREGLRKFALPLEYLPIVGASIVTLENRRWRIDSYRIDNMAIYVEGAVYDRRSAYVSNSTAPVRQPPTPPATTIRGPTDSVLLNIPPLRPEDKRPGIYWAPRGIVNTAWSGAMLQIDRAGIWVTVSETTSAANTGALLSDLPAYVGTIADTNTMQARMSGVVDSVTNDQLDIGANTFAVQYADATAELLQAQLVTEVLPNEYDCTHLLRGQMDTANALHVTGDRVVMISQALRFIPLNESDLGQTLRFRSVTLGTDPAEAEVQTITINKFESLWPVIPDQPHGEALVADGVIPVEQITSEDGTDFLFSD